MFGPINSTGQRSRPGRHKLTRFQILRRREIQKSVWGYIWIHLLLWNAQKHMCRFTWI